MPVPAMLWRSSHNPTAYDDDWEGQPGQGAWFQWGLGGVLPLALIAYGGHAIAMREATFGGQITMTLHGSNAIAYGIVSVR